MKDFKVPLPTLLGNSFSYQIEKRMRHIPHIAILLREGLRQSESPLPKNGVADLKYETEK